MNYREDEIEGSDLELLISILEKSEIDYVSEIGDVGENCTVIVNDAAEFVFDDEQNLIEVNPLSC